MYYHILQSLWDIFFPTKLKECLCFKCKIRIFVEPGFRGLGLFCWKIDSERQRPVRKSLKVAVARDAATNETNEEEMRRTRGDCKVQNMKLDLPGNTFPAVEGKRPLHPTVWRLFSNHNHIETLHKATIALVRARSHHCRLSYCKPSRLAGVWYPDAAHKQMPTVSWDQTSIN